MLIAINLQFKKMKLRKLLTKHLDLLNLDVLSIKSNWGLPETQELGHWTYMYTNGTGSGPTATGISAPLLDVPAASRNVTSNKLELQALRIQGFITNNGNDGAAHGIANLNFRFIVFQFMQFQDDNSGSLSPSILFPSGALSVASATATKLSVLAMFNPTNRADVRIIADTLYTCQGSGYTATMGTYNCTQQIDITVSLLGKHADLVPGDTHGAGTGKLYVVMLSDTGFVNTKSGVDTPAVEWVSTVYYYSYVEYFFFVLYMLILFLIIHQFNEVILSCYTLLSGFQLPLSPFYCRYESSPFF